MRDRHARVVAYEIAKLDLGEPPEYEPDDTEAQRIAEQFTEAAAEFGELDV